MSHAYLDTYKYLFAGIFTYVLSAIVVLSYLVLNSSKLPFIVVIALVGGDFALIVVANFIFTQATDAHLLSMKVIDHWLDGKNLSKVDRKFWEGMKPLCVAVGSVCTFETKEFLLFIWGEVVVSKIIDLLLAF